MLRIIKKINTSAALALDAGGREIVVLGKGIGFPKVPYELTDLSKIERTFYDVDSKYLNMIAGIPKSILLASTEIFECAEISLDCHLNPNLPFTLADHLSFAITRVKDGINLVTPIAYDMKHLYPREMMLGSEALDILEDYTGVRLPDDEAASITVHLINAESESQDLQTFVQHMNTIHDIENIVEEHLDLNLDHESYNYSRFIIHLQFLIRRLSSNKQMEGQSSDMLKTVAAQYPKVYQCVLKIAAYLKSSFGWECNQEEIFYLLIHIIRVQEIQKDDK